MLRDAIPEERRRDEIVGVAGILVARRGADELRDLTVHVLAREVVLMTLERVGERVMLESTRQREPACVAGIDVEIGEHFVHAAVLGVEHLRNLRVVRAARIALRPSGELRLELRAPSSCRCADTRRAARRTFCAACTTATRAR